MGGYNIFLNIYIYVFVCVVFEICTKEGCSMEGKNRERNGRILIAVSIFESIHLMRFILGR